MDKGNAVALINRTDYDRSMLAILSDTSKFVKLHIPPNKSVLNLILSHEMKVKKLSSFHPGDNETTTRIVWGYC